MQLNLSTIFMELPSMPYVLFGLAIISVIRILFLIFRPNNQPHSSHLDYTTIPFFKKRFLRDDEFQYFQVLTSLFGEHFHIFCQVRVEDFVETPRKLYMFRRFIMSHSVDFLLVLKSDRTKYLVIELNGITHSLPKRIERDNHLSIILKKAGVPYMIQPVHSEYNSQEVLEAVRRAFNRS